MDLVSFSLSTVAGFPATDEHVVRAAIAGLVEMDKGSKGLHKFFTRFPHHGRAMIEWGLME